MLSAPVIKKLEDSGLLNNLCLKKPAPAFAAIRNGCAMMNKLYSSSAVYPRYTYGSMEHKTKRYYSESEITDIADLHLDEMFYVLAYHTLLSNGRNPTPEEISDYLATQQEELSTHVTETTNIEFLRYTDLDYLQLAYWMLRKNFFGVGLRYDHIHVTYSTGDTGIPDSDGRIYLQYEYDEYGNSKYKKIPISVSYDESSIPEEFIAVQKSAIITGDLIKDGKAVVVDSQNIPPDIFIEPEKLEGLHAYSCFIIAYAKFEPKDTSWCGPLNSGT